MSIVLKVLLELITIEGGWNALFMEKKDEVINTSACRCLYSHGSIHISRGPNYFFVAIPRNIGLFHVASTFKSQKKRFTILHIQCAFYSTFIVDRSTNIYCTLNACLFCIV